MSGCALRACMQPPANRRPSLLLEGDMRAGVDIGTEMCRPNVCFPAQWQINRGNVCARAAMCVGSL